MLAGAFVSACGASAHPVTAPTAGTVLDQRLPAKLMHAELVDQDGHKVTLADFTGKLVVLQDTLTLCQEHCPIDTAAFVATARQYVQSARRPSGVVFLSITVDPQRDTPAQLRAYRHLYAGGSADLPEWHLLTGPPDAIHALWKFLGVYVQRVKPGGVVRNWRTGQKLTYDVNHSDDVFFLDRHGTERYLLDNPPTLGNNPIPAKIKHYMNARGHHNAKVQGTWTAAQALAVLDWLNHTSG